MSDQAANERNRTGFVRNIFTALVVLVSVWACLGIATPQVLAQDNLDYKLGSGDRIKVTVFGHEDLSGEFEVDGSGNVSLPLIRNVPAQGLTVSQLEQAVIERLRPDYLKDPSVSVEVLNYRPFYIYGEVNQPGSYPYASGMTVLKAVSMAGGFSYRAKKSEVKITRGSDSNRTSVEGSPETLVLPGDVIEVPERFF